MVRLFRGALQDLIEKKQFSFEINTEKKFEKLFNALEKNELHKTQGIFYDGQVFDAYVFLSELIRKASKSIIIIDNYIDETVLSHLTKARSSVKISILTKNITPQLDLDIKKYNKQYSKIQIIDFNLAHDRFLIIDEKEIYHIGASLKDLGKKWFAFSKFEIASFGLLEKVKLLIND